MDGNKVLKVLGIAALTTTVLLVIDSARKNREKKSNFNGTTMGNVVQFTLTNNTNKVQRVPMFNAWSGKTNKQVGITPSIEEFNRSLASEPKKVNMLEFRSFNNKKQVEVPVGVVCKDASGQKSTDILYPLVSAYQAQGGITSVQPKNFILDGKCFMVYDVLPNTTVTVGVYYDKYNISSELGKSKKKTKKKVAETC